MYARIHHFKDGSYLSALTVRPAYRTKIYGIYGVAIAEHKSVAEGDLQ